MAASYSNFDTDTDAFEMDGLDGDDSFVATDIVTHIDGGIGTDTLAANNNDFSKLSFTGIEYVDLVNGTTNILDSRSVAGQSIVFVNDGDVEVMQVADAPQAMDMSGLDLTGAGIFSVTMNNGGSSLDMGGEMSSSVHVTGGTGDDSLAYTDLRGTDDLNNVTSIENLVFGIPSQS